MTSPMTIMLLLKRVDCNDGVAAYVESLIAGLAEIGDRVVVVSGEVTTLFGSEARRRSIEGLALDWAVLDGLDRAQPTVANLRAVLSLIRRHRVDLLSPQGFQVLPLSAICGRLSGTPLVANFHLLQGKLSLRQRIAYRLIPTVFPADRYLAMSRDIASFFRDRCGISRSRIHEQSLGVDTTFFRAPTGDERRQARARFGILDTTLVGVLPGRMNRSKGHDLAAFAFRRLLVRRPEIATVCLFVGGGDERDRSEAEILRDDADRAIFRFLGFVDRQIMRDAYWAADIVLLPSRMEGFPLVVCEAMCCGAIVIRTPSSGWEEQVIEGTTGYVVPFDDPEALADAIEAVVDRPDRRSMHEAAMRLASTRFSRTAMVEGTAALYRTAAALQRPSGRTSPQIRWRFRRSGAASMVPGAGVQSGKCGDARSCD